MHVVLVHPEIAPNTGNIIRLCANAGLHLHLVEPLGFSLDERSLRRAGLDYHELVDVSVHANLDAARHHLPGRWFAFSSSGITRYSDIEYQTDDVLVFGAERTGLPATVLEALSPERILTIPMVAGNRSLNLANAVAIVVYEAWRQRNFLGSVVPAPSSGQVRGLTSESPGSTPFDG
ncbi:MAG: tRNA (cytidine(34)-2'-O)-methyltransferase [Acidimicrobiales bacterium]